MPELGTYAYMQRSKVPTINNFDGYFHAGLNINALTISVQAFADMADLWRWQLSG